jgi:hypothetical protein
MIRWNLIERSLLKPVEPEALHREYGCHEPLALLTSGSSRGQNRFIEIHGLSRYESGNAEEIAGPASDFIPEADLAEQCAKDLESTSEIWELDSEREQHARC